MRTLALIPFALVLGCTASRPAPGTPPLVVANDNRTAAGTLRDGVLTLDLDVVMGRWYPEAADGPFVDVPAFAEPGKPPSIPAPLIRVPVGTRVRLVIRNRLDQGAIGLWGPGITTKNDSSTVSLESGSTRTVEFTADRSGSYMYGARGTDHAGTRGARSHRREAANGTAWRPHRADAW